MSSHDDPEQRIRELERSLGDRTAELTRSSAETDSSQYGGGYGTASTAPPQSPYTAPQPPYPPPAYGVPPSYGAPFPPPHMSSGGRTGKRLIIGLIALIALITLGIAVGAVVFVANVFSSVSSFVDFPSGSPTVSGGGGPFGEPSTRSGVDRPQITISEPTLSSAPPGGDVSVSGVGENKTIECNDGIVSISGISNTVILTGHCTSVTVSGIENVVTVDAADAINASGLSNRVTYRTGTPDIQNSGSSNVVEQG